MASPLDRQRMDEALGWAERAIGLSDPNPRVGCVIGTEDGEVLGSGHTQEAGGAHAEIAALRASRAGGRSVKGATAWVTLEPCAHHGRTPPCCDALIEAGLARVVVAHVDPFPQVAGAGIARLRQAGVRVDMADPQDSARARELNIGFFSRVVRGRPWTRVKVAASLDGRTALPGGASQWITGEAARADGHAWRRRAGAILTGVGTVLADDPRLDVRLVPTALQPLRVVADSRLRMPLQARILKPPGRVLVATTAAFAGSVKAAQLRDAGAEVEAPQADGSHVGLAGLLAGLAERGVNELHVEAGAALNGALQSAGWVDEWLVYLAPTLLGDGSGIATLPAFSGLDSVPRFGFEAVERIGEDLRLRVRPMDGESWLAMSRP